MAPPRGLDKSQLNVQMPASPAVLADVRKLLGDQKIRVVEITAALQRDPIIAIELIKQANSVKAAGSGQNLVASLRKAVTALGVNAIAEILSDVESRPQLKSAEVSEWFERQRQRAEKIGAIASVIAASVNKQLVEDAIMIGLFIPIGELITIFSLQEKYVTIVTENEKRSQVIYQLSSVYGIDLEAVGVHYLELQSIPRAIWSRLRWGGDSLSTEGALVRSTGYAAAEMLESFDSGKWANIAPGKKIPPKSAIRMLQLSEEGYVKLYEKLTKLLTAGTIRPEEPEAAEGEQVLELPSKDSVVSTESETSETPDCAPAPESPSDSAAASAPNAAVQSLLEGDNAVLIIEQVASPPPAAVSKDIEARANLFGEHILNIANEVENSESFLTRVLEALVDEGPFDRAALLVVSRKTKSAFAVAARGLVPGASRNLSLGNATAEFFGTTSKVQSVKAGSSGGGLGAGPFAIAPIDVKHNRPVVLYADCGEGAILGFEARRVFRKIVDVLNEILPELEGGLPEEASEED